MSDLSVISPEDRIAASNAGYNVPEHITVVGGEEHMRDAKGRLVPVSTIKPQHLAEDQTVRHILKFAADLNAQIARFKEHTLADVGALLDLVAREYGVQLGGRKGNISLMTIDGLQMVKVAVADQVAFGPELQAAKALVDECLVEWSSDSHAALRVIVQAAFETEKEGQVSPAKLFPLLRHEIDDPRWRQAMNAVRDAIQIRGRKEYVLFYCRARPTDRWERITIDVASA